MKAAYQVGVGSYEVRDVSVPDVGADQVLIRVGACTICGTDVKYFKGLVELDWPSPMGHEVAGVIERVGANVTAFTPGDRVFSRMAWGGFAESVAAEAELVARLPDDIGFEEGAIAQMLPLAVRGASLAGVEGKIVLVSGLGGAGLNCIQACRALGACRVIGVDPVPLRRDVASEVGADAVLDPNRDDLDKRLADSLQDHADVAMEAAGVEASFRLCERMLRRGGILSVYGTHLDPLMLDMRHWERQCLQLHMMSEPPEDKPYWLNEAAKLLGKGRIHLKPILSGVMTLDQIMDAFDWVIHHPDEVIKVAVVPRGETP